MVGKSKYKVYRKNNCIYLERCSEILVTNESASLGVVKNLVRESALSDAYHFGVKAKVYSV